MTVQPSKRKRKEKPKNRPSARRLTLFTGLIIVFIGAALYILSEQQSKPAMTSPFVQSAPSFAGICNITDGAYQIKVVEPYVEREQRTSADGQHTLTVDENGSFVGSPEQPYETQVYATGMNFQIYPSPDSRFFATLSAPFLHLIDSITGEIQEISSDATHVYSWSPDGTHLVFVEDEEIVIRHVESGHEQTLPAMQPPHMHVIEFGWSPDGRYLEQYYMDNEIRKIRIFDVETLEQINLDSSAQIHGRPSWSPDGDAVAYVHYSGGAGEDGDFAYMVVINPLQKLMRKSALFTAISDVTGSIYLVWSPDSQYIAVFQYNPDSHHYEVLVDSVDGQQRAYVVDDVPLTLSSTSLYLRAEYFAKIFFWKLDDNSLYIWREPHNSSNQAVSLYQFNVPEYFLSGHSNQVDPFMEHILTIPKEHFLSAFALEDYYWLDDVRRIAYLQLDHTGNYQIDYPALSSFTDNIYIHAGKKDNGLYSVDVFDLFKDTTLNVVSDATAIGEPFATNEGKNFAVTWSDNLWDDPERRVFITWVDIETGETHTLRGDFKSVYDLLWSADNDWLAYTYWRGDDTGVEIINRETKAIHSLVTKAASIEHKEYDAVTGLWSVWWTDANNQARVALFNREGERVFGIEIHTGLKNPRTWQTYTFPSPTDDEVVFKLVQDEGEHEYLVLLDEDDDMKMLADNVQGLGDPDWSLDGQYVLWSHYRENAFQFTVSIADAEGERLWQTKLKDLPQLIWSECD